MSIFLALLKKEFIVVFRDIHALLALFALPAVFIIIMSYSLKDVAGGGQNLKCLYYIDKNNSIDFTQNFMKNIDQLQGFTCKKSEDDKLPRESDLLILIPSGFFDAFGADINSSLSVRILYQPTLNQTTIYLLEALLKEKIITLYTNDGDSEYTPIFVTNLAKPFIKSSPSSVKIPNGTEQSVPAWIVFAMFFILIPLSTVLIVEKEQGTYKRLKSIGLSPFLFFSAKMAAYNIVNFLQCIVLLSVGVFIVPIFGMEALKIESFTSLFVLIFALSFAVIGFALFIASICKSSSQAVIVGGVSNILLGAIGGVMIPKYIMPPLMQKLSDISPMSWGLDAFIKILLDNAAVDEISRNIVFLLFFGIIMFLISVYIFTKKRGD